jgi:hypothetical protein
VDWTFRVVTYNEKTVKVTNQDVLLALRRHHEDGVGKFDGNQALVRDCLDAMLAFFNRIETALSTGLIEEAPTRRHFEYWLTRRGANGFAPRFFEGPRRGSDRC